MKRIDKNNPHTYISGPLRRTPLKVASFDFSGAATKRELYAYREYLKDVNINNFPNAPIICTSIFKTYRSYIDTIGLLVSNLYDAGTREFYQILRDYALRLKTVIETFYESWSAGGIDWDVINEDAFTFLWEDLTRSYLALTLVQKIMRQRGHLTFKIPKTLKEKFSWCLLHLYDHMRERGFR